MIVLISILSGRMVLGTMLILKKSPRLLLNHLLRKVNKFMLAIKREEQYGTAAKETFEEHLKSLSLLLEQAIGLWTGRRGPTLKGVRRLEARSTWISTAITSLILGRLQQPMSQRIPVVLAWLGDSCPSLRGADVHQEWFERT